MNDYNMTVRDIKTKSRALLRGHYERFGMMVVICAVIKALFSLIGSGAFPDTSKTSMLIMSFVVSYLLEIIAAMFSVGLSNASLNIVRSESIGLTNIVYAFKNQSNSFLLLETILVGISAALQLPAMFLDTKNSWAGIFEYFLFTAASLFMAALLTLRINFAVFVLMDNPQYTLTRALSESMRITEGNYIRILKLYLSFIPMYLLGIASFLVGYLLIIPYMKTAMAVMYEELS